jgi:diguanylate cyclase (GGDEF)-like protein
VEVAALGPEAAAVAGVDDDRPAGITRTPAVTTFLTRSDFDDDLTPAEIPADDLVDVLAVRLVLAIDALFELGAFVVDEELVADRVVRQIASTVPPGGLGPPGYRRELQSLAADLSLTLDRLAAEAGSGSAPSDGPALPSVELRRVAEALDDVVIERLDRGAVDVVEPVEWIEALSDLVVRAGAAPEDPGARVDDTTPVLALASTVGNWMGSSGPAATATTIERPTGDRPELTATTVADGATGDTASGPADGAGETPATVTTLSEASGSADRAESGEALGDQSADDQTSGSDQAAGADDGTVGAEGEGDGQAETVGGGIGSDLSTVETVLFLAGWVLAGVAGWLLTRRRRSGRVSSDPAPPADPAAGPVPATPLPSGAAGEHPLVSLADLVDAGRRMAAALDATEIAAIAIGEARRLIGADGGAVVRRHERELRPLRADPPALFAFGRSEHSALWPVVEAGRSTAVVVDHEPILVKVPMAMAAVPVVADGAVVGALAVIRVASRPFSQVEVEALETLAPLIGSSLQAAAVHDSAAALAESDPLTGLANRRRLDRDLSRLAPGDGVDRPAREGSVAVVMVDVDHFKNFNDRNGHAAGDEALRRVGAALVDAVRPGDTVYRYGGEEFLILLPGATTDQAAIVAERCRAAVATGDVPGGDVQPGGRVTISVGVAGSDRGSFSDLVRRADSALYRAKEAGRNQVLVDR